MDRNFSPGQFPLCQLLGQARKSLWIETKVSNLGLVRPQVRLVRACGSKLACTAPAAASRQGQARKSLWIETAYRNINLTVAVGQARKSLWIETMRPILISLCQSVRLVRACGSKQHLFNRRLYHQRRVRLVRACGSKLFLHLVTLPSVPGQARKSLWIETIPIRVGTGVIEGQARKSLWIETGHGTFHSPRELGQARKSLWIETAPSSWASCCRSGSGS